MPESRSDPTKSAASKAGRRQLPARGPPLDASDFSIVAIGASAGGLDACMKFLAALPGDSGMAYILVQHLDPTHESMMVDLLAGHTSMTVRQATDAMVDRARPPLHHSARSISLCCDGRAAPLCPASASRRAAAVRLSSAFVGRGLRSARHLRDPVGHRSRRLPWAEIRQGKWRADHCSGTRRGRI